MRVVAADERGRWARFDLWRDHADRPFDRADADLFRDVSGVLGSGMRKATVALGEPPATTPTEAGVLLVGADLTPRGRTPAIDAWFRALNPAGIPYPAGIPSLVWSTIGRLIAVEAGEDPARPVRIRARGDDGAWAVIDAARLDDADRTITISVHAAAVGDLLALVSRAFGLSVRERQLVTLIVRGRDTSAIAERMFISPYTVQDHLRSVFDKLGVHSRLELVTRLLAQTGPASA